MEEIILVVLLVCGKIDTFILKSPDQKAVFTHKVKSPKIQQQIADILSQNPVIITYEDDRGYCV